jgi:hypothetical protein
MLSSSTSCRKQKQVGVQDRRVEQVTWWGGHHIPHDGIPRLFPPQRQDGRSAVVDFAVRSGLNLRLAIPLGSQRPYSAMLYGTKGHFSCAGGRFVAGSESVQVCRNLPAKLSVRAFNARRRDALQSTTSTASTPMKDGQAGHSVGRLTICMPQPTRNPPGFDWSINYRGS